MPVETLPATCGSPLPRIGPQRFLNGEVHDWYRIILGYSDHLVAGLLDRLAIQPGQRVLDPFCGTGTTLIECRKRSISSAGIEANPSSIFAARVKTRWELDPGMLLVALDEVESLWRHSMRRSPRLADDPTYRYIEGTGMLARGWISPLPLSRAIRLKQAIVALPLPQRYRDFFMLGLIAEVVAGASNVKFGPELYIGPKKDDHDVFAGFRTRVLSMITDISIVADAADCDARVFEGDARDMAAALAQDKGPPFDAVISSPPYPAEHDYTRNSRLELAFLEDVTSLASLRMYKKRMIRSHTKGVYVADRDAAQVARYGRIQQIAGAIDRRVRGNTDGFARLYSTVVRQYFGGMKRHLKTLMPQLRTGAQLAYVVGDQSSYASVHIPTAEILADIATRLGYRVGGIEEWRARKSSTTQRHIGEHILMLTKPVIRGKKRG